MAYWHSAQQVGEQNTRFASRLATSLSPSCQQRPPNNNATSRALLNLSTVCQPLCTNTRHSRNCNHDFAGQSVNAPDLPDGVSSGGFMITKTRKQVGHMHCCQGLDVSGS